MWLGQFCDEAAQTYVSLTGETSMVQYNSPGNRIGCRESNTPLYKPISYHSILLDIERCLDVLNVSQSIEYFVVVST